MGRKEKREGKEKNGRYQTNEAEDWWNDEVKKAVISYPMKFLTRDGL